jgi:hypothetical protein
MEIILVFYIIQSIARFYLVKDCQFCGYLKEVMDRIFLIKILESGDPALPELMVFSEI